MATAKLLVICIQFLAIGAAAARICYLILENVDEDDKTPLKKRVRNVVKILILIELVISVGEMIQRYY